MNFLQETVAQENGGVPPRAEAGATAPETLEERAARLQKEVEHQQALLLRSQQLNSLGVMASGLAHEIMQPLQLILSTVQNCRRDVLRHHLEAPFLLEDLDYLTEMTKRIDYIVNHLHVLSRESKPRHEAVILNRVAEDALSLFGEQLKARGITVRREFAADLPPVFADKIQLEQVFINLINNARDALEGCESKQITLRTAVQGETVTTVFADNGCGIAPDKLDAVFDPFYTSKEKGIGLGLYITRDILYNYQGDITVTSTPGQGTAFTLTLPVMQETTV